MSEIRASAFMTRYYKQLVGATVVSFHYQMEEDDEDAFSTGDWPTFTMEKDGEQFDMQVSRDTEGNGPGFLFGLPDIREAKGKE